MRDKKLINQNYNKIDFFYNRYQKTNSITLITFSIVDKILKLLLILKKLW